MENDDGKTHSLMLFSHAQTPRKSIFAALVVIGAIASVTAQLSYHSDANTNSYTLQTPNSQQTFTRYYGQQQSGNGIAAGQLQGAQSQQQVEKFIHAIYRMPTNVFPIRSRWYETFCINF